MQNLIPLKDLTGNPDDVGYTTRENLEIVEKLKSLDTSGTEEYIVPVVTYTDQETLK